MGAFKADILPPDDCPGGDGPGGGGPVFDDIMRNAQAIFAAAYQDSQEAEKFCPYACKGIELEWLGQVAAQAELKAELQGRASHRVEVAEQLRAIAVQGHRRGAVKSLGVPGLPESRLVGSFVGVEHRSILPVTAIWGAIDVADRKQGNAIHRIAKGGHCAEVPSINPIAPPTT